MSNDNGSEPRRRVSWLGIASLLVAVTRLVLDLWRKDWDRRPAPTGAGRSGSARTRGQEQESSAVSSVAPTSTLDTEVPSAGTWKTMSRPPSGTA